MFPQYSHIFLSRYVIEIFEIATDSLFGEIIKSQE